MVLAAAMALASAELYALPVSAAQIINPNPLVDIVVNPCSDYNVSYAKFSQDLADALKADGMDMSTVRITQAGIQLNTLDLSEWYVYDHCDNNIISSSGFDTHNGRSPYFANTAYSSSSYTIPTMNIVDWFSNGYCNRSAYSSEPGNVAALDRHILSDVDAYGKASMKFAGYGTGAYNDFLFYPASTRYKKAISFDIDASKVKLHSMNGAGFLVNAGVDTAGKLQGYLLYFAFNSDVTNATVTLYRLKGDQTPETIHGTVGIAGINKTAVGDPATIVLQSTKKTKVYIDISTDYLTVQEQPYTDGNGTMGTLNTVMNNIGINTAAAKYTNYNGFGPFVSYSGHNCSDTSYFIFSDLVMSYQTDAFESVRNSQFAQDRANETVERFFVNLAKNDPEIPDVTSEFNEGTLRLINDRIKYISNCTDSTTVTGSDVKVSDIIGSGNTYYTQSPDYATYVREIASYICNHGEWVTEGINAPELTAPAANFTIVGKDPADAGSEYVQTLSIHKKHLSNDGASGTIRITFDDSSYSVDEATRPIIKWEYSIRNSNGVIVEEKTVLSTSSDKTPPYIDITSVSPEGTYTLTLTVTDSLGVVSTSSTRAFTVINDTTAPTVSVASDASATGKATLAFTDDISGVLSYYIGTYTSDLAKTSFTTARAEASVTVDVPQDGTSLVVNVWDECGNFTTKTYSTSAVTFIKGLSDNTTQYGETLYVLNGCAIGVLPETPVDDVNVPAYGFTGWYKEALKTNVVSASTVITAATTLYGGWNSSFCNIAFNANGGVFDGTNPLSVPKGTPYSSIAAAVPAPTKAGYDFNGWTVDGSALGTRTATADATFTATWTTGNVTLVLDPNGGVSGKYSSLTALNGTAFNKVIDNYGTGNTKPTRSGYLFSHWTYTRDVATATLSSSNKLGDNGGTVYAYWTRDPMLFASATLAEATYGSAYSQKVSATNGTGKYSYALADGSALPEGLTLNTASGVISGTVTQAPSVTPVSFSIIASEIVTEGMTATAPITRSFSIKVSAGSAPVLTNQTVNVKADATDIETAVKQVYESVIGVESVDVTGTNVVSAEVTKFTVTVSFNSNFSSNKTQAGLVITADLINPAVEFTESEVPGLKSDSRENYDEDTLLEYLNSYGALQLKAEGNSDYNLALGTAPASISVTYAFADEASDPRLEFKRSGNVIYNFETTYFGNTLNRLLAVDHVDDAILIVNADAIRRFVGDADFDPAFEVTYTGVPITGAALTYTLPDNAAGVVTLSGGKLHIVGAGQVSAVVKATAPIASSADTYFDIIISEKPEVNTSVAVTDAYGSAKLYGTVVAGSETPTAAGFKYKKTGDSVYTMIPAVVAANGTFMTEIRSLDLKGVYEFFAFVTTPTGTVTSPVRTLTFTEEKETDKVTTITANGYGEVYYPTAADKNTYRITAPKDSTGLAINHADPSVKPDSVSVTGKKYINASVSENDPSNAVTLNSDGTISIGANVMSAVISVRLSDGGYLIIDYVKGTLNIDAINESETVVSDVDQENLRSAIGSDELTKLLEDGNTVDVNLIVSDLVGQDDVVEEMEEYAKQHIGENVTFINLDIKIRQIVNGDEENASYITTLNNKIFIEIKVAPEFLENAYDLKLLHKKHDGTIEEIDVVRNGDKLGFYAQEFSPYTLVAQRKFTVTLDVTGSGRISSADGKNEWLEGENVTLNIVPDDGFKIGSIIDNGEKKDVTEVYVITGIADDHTIEITFTAVSADGGSKGDNSANPDTGRAEFPLVEAVLVVAMLAAVFTAVTLKPAKEQ